MIRMFLYWLFRAVVVLAIVFVVFYVGDWAAYRLRGSPHSSVNVTRFVVIPLKGQKQEFDSLGTADTLCSVSLFPQSGLDACWCLRRHPDQWVNY